MSDLIHAAGYCRVSTAIQASEGESLDIQRQQITDYCLANNLNLVEIFGDEGVSGKTQDRPALIALLKRVGKGEFKAVVVTRLTRFGRSTRDLVNNLGVLDDNGVLFVSLKEKIDTSTPAGRLLRTMLIAIAEFEHEVITEQMGESRTARWREGRIFIGLPPYGYGRNRETKSVEIIPQEATIYQNMVNWYLDEGLSFLNVALRLKEQGVRLRRSQPRPPTIQYIMRNPIYTGTTYVNKFEYEKGKRTKKLRPATDHIEVRVEPLITKTRWDAIQERIKHNTSKSKRVTTSRNFWLRDMLRCGECGATIKPHRSNYACFWRIASTKELTAYEHTRCELPLIPATELEEAVWDELVSRISFGFKGAPSNLETITDPSRYDAEIAEQEVQLATLDAELKKLKTIRTRLFSMLEKDDFNQEEFTQRLRAIDEEIQRIQSRFTDIHTNIRELMDLKSSIHDLSNFITQNRQWLHQIQEQLNNLGPDDKKRVVESLIVGKIEVELIKETGGWGHGPLRIRFNSNIFKRLAEEGKIIELDSNSRDYFMCA